MGKPGEVRAKPARPGRGNFKKEKAAAKSFYQKSQTSFKEGGWLLLLKAIFWYWLQFMAALSSSRIEAAAASTES
jgi:hypothetical protein